MSDEDELIAIKNELTDLEKYCAGWADAYPRAAAAALEWNTRLVVIGVVLAAVTSALSGTSGVAGSGAAGTAVTSLWFFGLIGAVVGIVTTVVTGFQKLPFASPEQSKQYHSTAAGYGSARRDIKNAKTSTALADIKTQRKTITTQLKELENQAPELPQKYHPQGLEGI
jgi:hypothetical protein